MTPDWIPNIHPLIVHFPIALLVAAVFVDAVRLFKKDNWLHKTAVTLYTTGTVGLAAAFLSGRNAIETVSVTGSALPVAATHEDWALNTLLFFSIFTIVRFITFWKDLEKKRILSVFVLLGFAGTGMLWYTGDLGGQLVYKHGVAVGEIDRLQQRIETLEQDLSAFRKESGPVVEENGSWVWRIGPGAEQIIHAAFSTAGDISFSVDMERDDSGYYLNITPGSEPAFLLSQVPLRHLSGRLEVNVSRLEGEVMLVHHYRDPQNFQYLKLTPSELVQGRIENGRDTVFQSGEVNTESWVTIRVTASGQHYYGYMGGQAITHSHSEELPEGLTGISFSGEGFLHLRVIEFESTE